MMESWFLYWGKVSKKKLFILSAFLCWLSGRAHPKDMSTIDWHLRLELGC